MEVGNKRHGKKSDKETQSPVLKVFREMIQRENTDPEKANLLREKQEKRKRRQYSGSRSKSDRVQRSGDSSSSEKHRHSVQYKVGVDHDQRVQDYNQCRSQSIPFQGEKKDSWWFWGDTADKNNKKSEETCSCVSCALKRIISSEYTCIACLGVLFLLSVLVAFMVLFRTVPIVAKEMSTKGPSGAVKKTESRKGGKDRRMWDDTMTRRLSSLTGLNGNDFDDGYRELNSLEDAGLRYDSELAGVLNTDSLNDGLSSERLRNFYKKLIQTDAQIRNLKKSVGDYNTLTNYGENKYYIADRAKRSLKLRGPKSLLKFNMKKKEVERETPLNMAELQKFNLYYPPITALNSTKKRNRKVKRFINTTDEPTGFLIEKKQILVQYKPHGGLRKVPKCSHAPKDSKSHEKQLKHPFYKNTQRLDELLDQFLDKNLPDMMVDPFGVEVLFKHKDKMKSHKTNVVVENEASKKTTVKSLGKDKPKFVVKEHFKPKLDKEFFDMISSINKNDKHTSSTPAYDVLLSVSTIVNPGLRKITKPLTSGIGKTPSLLERVPHIRKLMQVEEDDDEGLGYEDFKEVLTDDSETHDENDKIQNRKKRMEDYIQDENKIQNIPRVNPPGVHNPNWKGPMPLYPDELSSMIKQAAIENVNKIAVPISKDVTSEMDGAERDLSDVEYIENYSDDKFGKLVEMAQAYSDYGVLEGKKESARNDNKGMDSKEVDRRVKLSVNKGKALKEALLEKFRKRKCTVAEGIRFEIRPTTTAREDSPIAILKALQKHVKITNDGKGFLPHFHSTQMPINAEYTLFSAAVDRDASQRRGGEAKKQSDTKLTTKFEDMDVYEDSSDGVVFTIGKKSKESRGSESSEDTNNIFEDKNSQIWRRSLKSFDDTGEIHGDIKVQDSTDLNYNDNHDKIDDDDIDIDVMVSILNKPKKKVKRDVQDVKNLETVETYKKMIPESKNDQKNKQLTNITANKSSSLFESNVLTNVIKLNKNKSSEMDLSEFFMVLSDWFGLLAGTENKPKSEIMKLTTKVMTNSKSDNKSINIEFASYDSDMIENIGHRSRVLLAIEEPHDTISTNPVDVTEINTSIVKEKTDVIDSSSVVDKTTITTAANSTIAEQKSSNTNILTTQHPTTAMATEKEVDKKTKMAENKTLVKRNVPDDSNLIFWNDMYDDEYGVKLDPLDSIRERQNFKGMEFVKKSGNWIQDKVKNIANNFRGKEKNIVTNGMRRLRGARYLGTNPFTQDTRDKYVKRAATYEEDETNENPNSFTQLTAKMKEVCKEAAKAVQQTKNVKVRQEEKEDSMTSSLMQQLVRLMTDLVDFQVQQKTCVKLPPDLQEFLEWLTVPNPEQLEMRNHKVGYNDDNLSETQTEQVLDLTPSSEKEEVHPDSRSDCLGTLHAVQDLMQQFDEMTDEDKSKMTGIREYLENQLQFLHKQLAMYDESQMYKVPSMIDEENPTARYRRDLKDTRKQRNPHNQRRRSRFKRRFIKNFGKKHTRTTASIYDGYPITEVEKLTKLDTEDVKNKDDTDVHKVDKRNLRDVYYKALNDAKKPTTIKNFHKEELDGFDNAQIVRIEA